jgi:hypothetical protein
MHKRSSRSRADVNVLATRIVQSIADIDVGQKNPAAVALGRMGGLKGGKARAAKLSPKVKTAIARKAARARWGKR